MPSRGSHLPQRRRSRWHTQIVVWLSLAVLAGCTPPKPSFGRPHIDAVNGPATIISRGQIVNHGREIYDGPIDVNPTLDRIRAGKKLDHGNDGTYFRNFERLLPKQSDPQYYREFVHVMRGLPFPGPQRVVIGKRGEVYYTGDHYDSFRRVH
ncbi:MAG TPA: ribonuclease domain-containing protein [Terrimicrobiaceae bacterium]